MEREFRFRAWHNETEQMLFVGDSFGTKHPLDCVNYARQGQDVVLMQYVGLKDKNGTPIFEGDLIELEGKFLYVVRFEDAKFVCYHANKPEWGKWGDLHRLFDPDFIEYDHKVIGNIYSNPELINKATS